MDVLHKEDNDNDDDDNNKQLITIINNTIIEINIRINKQSNQCNVRGTNVLIIKNCTGSRHR
jgi:hypothetical protein